MNIDAIHLAKQNNDFIQQELGEAYTLISANLVGVLAIQGTSLEELRSRELLEIANRQLISNYVAQLPTGVSVPHNPESGLHCGDGLYVSGPDEVRAFTGNTLWVKGQISNGIDGIKPYAVVGDTQKGKVLVAPYPLKDGVRSFINPTSHYKLPNYDPQETYIVEGSDRKGKKTLASVMKAMNEAACREPDSDQLQRLYDPTHNLFRLTPGSARVPEVITATTEPLGKLSDLQMAEFNVFHYLSRLELQFQTYPALNQCYDQMLTEFNPN